LHREKKMQVSPFTSLRAACGGSGGEDKVFSSAQEL
jgi:hypothetical protein